LRFHTAAKRVDSCGGTNSVAVRIGRGRRTWGVGFGRALLYTLQFLRA
jgi:hypothetical protein